MESEFTVENLLFVEAVDALYEIPDRMFLQEHLGKIYTTFISDSAEYPIPLPAHIRAPIVQAFESSDEEKRTIRREIFDAARDNVFMLIKHDAFRRYLKSPLYAEFAAQAEKGNRSTSFQVRTPSKDDFTDNGIQIDVSIRKFKAIAVQPL